jgi:hypothetical protein
MLEAFCDWLQATSLSTQIQVITWIIPAVQIIHILCLAVVLSSVALLDLRLMGVGAQRTTITGMAAHVLPWIWMAIILMALTGTVLTIGEPRRELLNPVFQTKMILVGAAILLTFGFQEVLRRNAQFWDRDAGHRLSVRLFGAVFLALWFTIAVCGRLIAYAKTD